MKKLLLILFFMPMIVDGQDDCGVKPEKPLSKSTRGYNEWRAKYNLWIECKEKADKASSLIYYSSNYVTAWDVSYGEEDRQKMDVYLRGQQYVDRNNHNVRMKGEQGTNVYVAPTIPPFGRFKGGSITNC